MKDWYASLRAVQSKGSTAQRPGSLAGLAAARRIHQGQFFTPDGVSELMWRIASQAMEGVEHSLAIFDNSVGSGRLLQFAEPGKHRLFGVDVDEEAVAALSQAATDAGFEIEFEAVGMEAIQPRNMDVALINPPFSVHLEAPSIYPFPCTTYGKFGPGTSTVSHAYALAQAVQSSAVVVALLPATFAAEVVANPASVLEDDDAARLTAHVELPPGLFREENTDVRVSLLVFDATKAKEVRRISLEKLDDPLPDLDLYTLGNRYSKSPGINIIGIDDDGPSIALPVTGDNTVRVVHDGRAIGLRFKCGLTQAKVQNAILREHVERKMGDEYHRYPKGVKYAGQGVLDVEAHLAQEHPISSFENFIDAIRQAGGKPEVDNGLRGYLSRRMRQSARQATPLRHTVWVKPGTASEIADELVGKAKKDHIANAKAWGSPVIKAGTEIAFKRAEDGRYDYDFKGRQFRVTPEELAERFEIVAGAEGTGWRVVHEGLAAKFPQQAHALKMKAFGLGIDKWLAWQFQMDDLVELALKPQGAIAAWEMGLGKARLAVALALLSGCKESLITVEAGLAREMEIELEGLPIPADTWQIIRTPEQAKALRKINVIAYERLRMPINGNRNPAKKLRVKDTYAGLLRRRVGMTISDEGDMLSNPESQQSRCLWNVSAKRRYVLTGTPLANYPRDILPILAFTGGDGTAAQRYGYRGGYVEERWITSMTYAQRGIDKFKDQFVTLEWVTKEFEDGLIEGAKREIPRIRDLAGYRAMIAPHVKRRIAAEPEVTACVKMPTADYIETVVQWDEAHLAHYLRVCEEFQDWYLGMREKSGLKGSNLVAILARIQAVSMAQDFPQHGHEHFGAYGRLTSKQRYVVNRVVQLAKEGHKIIVYAENPGVLEIISRHLDPLGVKGVLFHGGIPAKTRMKELDARYRFGDEPAMYASLGVTAKGLNIPQADYVIMLSRSWSATVEAQACGRPLRPQQKRKVTVERVHLEGGLDIYKAQMVEFKKDCAQAGLDWGTPETDEIEFLHMDTIIHRFMEGLAKLKGVETHKLREALAA